MISVCVHVHMVLQLYTFMCNYLLCFHILLYIILFSVFQYLFLFSPETCCDQWFSLCTDIWPFCDHVMFNSVILTETIGKKWICIPFLGITSFPWCSVYRHMSSSRMGIYYFQCFTDFYFLVVVLMVCILDMFCLWIMTTPINLSFLCQSVIMC